MDEPLGTREDLLAGYAAGPDRLETAVAGLPEAELDLAESQATWTLRQIVHHVADGDDLWKSFILRAIGNLGGEFDLQWYWAIPQHDWARRWAYVSRDITPSLALFRANRTRTVQLLQHLPAAWEQSLLVRWPNRQAEHVTVVWVVNMQAQHLLGHLQDIQRVRQLHAV